MGSRGVHCYSNESLVLGVYNNVDYMLFYEKDNRYRAR